ncbi:hypothetical protein D1164_09070 [Mariniphaga sediminis]|jgi:hypothetical protein|uniref:DUF998 domain-containing protein n=1 Tax=Mariniphaga sediminis TaxID=1628158 RepID=A0A399D553_9BACT|nr:hypothetical protein [Mariniphaga sediminis]RIH65792.1 hypothetical protein D1164_09070 [Mariniphaga sediminis]
MLIKLGILLVGFTYAGFLPFAVKRSIQLIDFDLKKYTLSFLSNKKLYGKIYVQGYKRLLFATAILNYLFFWLLSLFYDLGENERFMQQINYSFACLTLLAFVPHNIYPYSRKRLVPSLQRLFHNLLALIVFVTLPVLIVMFQTAVLPDLHFLGVSGLVIIGGVVFITLISVLLNGINGVTEMLFINGISIWSIFVTIMTFIR